ncbi:MAG TPA: phosphate ABC transporter permease PstA [Candidatus Limnocylindrales bacterium]|nr:phosphate ABC transporter permease PstA [Candidatus Limnocylindrales bacterium]
MTARLRADRLATATLWAIAIAVVGLLLTIILNFVIKSIGVVSPSFLTSAPSGTELGGIGPLFFNSMYLLALTLLINVPLGTLGGIYMAEYAADNRLTNTIRFCQELISSVPSIVVGLFGLAVFVTTFGWGYSALAGALALTVFNLPLMTRLTEGAIRAVPADERAASLALGATKWQTITRVVLPIAIPGVVTGIILTAGRIFGEAAALIFTSGSSTPSAFDYGYISLTDPRSPWSPFHTATTMSVYIWHVNSEGLGNFVAQIANGTSAVLILTVLLFNLGARGLGRVLQRRVSGA